MAQKRAEADDLRDVRRIVGELAASQAEVERLRMEILALSAMFTISQDYARQTAKMTWQEYRARMRSIDSFETQVERHATEKVREIAIERGEERQRLSADECNALAAAEEEKQGDGSDPMTHETRTFNNEEG